MAGKIEIYDKDDKHLATLVEFREATKYRCLGAENEEYYLHFIIARQELKTDYLYNNENYLECENDYFRVSELKEIHDASGIYLEVYAEHISYDLINDIINEKLEYTGVVCSQPLTAILNGTSFSFLGTDVTISRDFVIEAGTNVREALSGIAQIYDGEYKYFKKTIYFYNEIGQTRNIVLALGKNVDDVKRTLNYAENTTTYEITISENSELQELGYYELGDKLTVYDEALGINVETRVVEYEKDIVRGLNTTVTLGQPTLSINTAFDNMLNRVAAELGTTVDDLKQSIQAVEDGEIVTYYQAEQPETGKEGDLWYKSTSNGAELYRYSGKTNSWKEIEDKNALEAIANAATAQSTADGKIVTYYNNSAPSNASNGDLWFDTDDENRMYRYDGSQWIDLQEAMLDTIADNLSTAINGVNSTIQGVEDGVIVTYYQSTEPTGKNGDLWYKQLSNGAELYRHNGTSWVKVEDTNALQAIADAADAQSTADGKIYTYYQASQPTSGMGVGDLWVDINDNNKLYRYSGASWVSIQDLHLDETVTNLGTTITNLSSQVDGIEDGLTTTYYSTVQPSGGVAGDLWYKQLSSGAELYRYSGSSWVKIEDANALQAIADAADAQSTADGKILTFYQTSQPTSGSTGDLWFDTDDGNKLYRYNGTSWVSVQDEAIAQVSSNLSDAITTLNATISGVEDGMVTTYYQSSQPSGVNAGDLWYKQLTSGAELYRYDGSAWTKIEDKKALDAVSAAQSAQTTADGKIVTYYQTNSPTDGSNGDLWIDIDDGNKLYRHDGSSWVNVQDAAIGSAQETADAALAKVSGIVDANGALVIAKVANALNGAIDSIVGTTGKATWVSQGLMFHNQATVAASTQGLLISPNGLLVANGKNADGSFNWRSAITGAGISADEITTGTLSAITINGVTITGSSITGTTVSSVSGSKLVKMADGKLIIGNNSAVANQLTIDYDTSNNYVNFNTSSANIYINSGSGQTIVGANGAFIYLSSSDAVGSVTIQCGANTLSGFSVNCNVASFGNAALSCGSIAQTTDSYASLGYVTCAGLSCSSYTKNRVIKDTPYGDLYLFSYETPEVYYGDIGHSSTVNGTCTINIDEKLVNSVIDTTINYEVFLTKYGPGDIWVSERHPTYFVVQSQNDINFGYEIKAKAKDATNIRFYPDNLPE